MQVEHLPDGSFRCTTEMPDWIIKALDEATTEEREQLEERVKQAISDACIECCKAENITRIIDDSILYGDDYAIERMNAKCK